MKHTQSKEIPQKRSLLVLIVFCSLHMQHDYFNIRKTRARDSDETKTVFFETSRGGYVAADDEVSLTNYLVHLPNHNGVIVDIDVE